MLRRRHAGGSASIVAVTALEIVEAELDWIDDEDEMIARLPLIIAKYREMGFYIPDEWLDGG